MLSIMTFVSTLGVLCSRSSGLGNIVDTLCGELMGESAGALLASHLSPRIDEVLGGLPLNSDLRRAMAGSLRQGTRLVAQDLLREVPKEDQAARQWVGRCPGMPGGARPPGGSRIGHRVSAPRYAAGGVPRASSPHARRRRQQVPHRSEEPASVTVARMFRRGP